MRQARWLMIAGCLLALIAAPTTGIAQDSDAATSDGPPPNAENPRRGAFDIDVVYSTVATDPSSDVPGVVGAKFDLFDRVYGAPGTNWILTASTDQDIAEDEVLIVNGVVEAREGTPAPWTGDVDNTDNIDQRLVINDAGEFAFATDTDGDTTTDEYIILGTPVEATLTEVAQEGDSADPPLTGATWDSLDSPVIAADGTVGFISSSIDGLPSGQDEAAVLGTTVIAQVGVTVPTGQDGGATEAWDLLDFEDYFINSDGTSWLLQGDLEGSTTSDDVVVVDGAVVIQEGVVLPGSGFPNPVDIILEVHMDPAGNWLARGDNDVSDTDWVVRNGTVAATLGDPAFTGASEVWDDTDYSAGFFLNVGDTNGNWLIGGVTDAPSDTNGLLVLNGTTEVAREGDPVDLDGNGSFDDDTFIDTFGNDDAYITSTGIAYLVVALKDATGADAGDAFISIDLSSVIPVELQSFSVE